MILAFQIIFVLVSLVAIWGVVQRRQERLLGPRGALFWTLFWIAADIAVIWPESTTMLANLFGIGRGTDFVLYVGLVILFFLLFRLHIKIESVGRDVTRVVRDRAIE